MLFNVHLVNATLQSSMNEQLAINNGQLAFYKNCRKKLESLLHAQEPHTITLPNTPNPQQSVSHDTERAFELD